MNALNVKYYNRIPIYTHGSHGITVGVTENVYTNMTSPLRYSAWSTPGLVGPLSDTAINFLLRWKSWEPATLAEGAFLRRPVPPIG